MRRQIKLEGEEKAASYLDTWSQAAISTPKDVPVCPLVRPPQLFPLSHADSAKDKQAIRLRHGEAAPGLCPSQEATVIQARGLQGRVVAAGPQGRGTA